MTDRVERASGTIPESFLDIPRKPAFGHLSTIDPDGWPQTTPVWVDHDGDEAILVNTATGRRKERNLRRNRRASISMVDPDDPYRYLAVRGTITMTTDGAAAHIDALAEKYLGLETYPHHESEEGERLIVRIPAGDVIARE